MRLYALLIPNFTPFMWNFSSLVVSGSFIAFCMSLFQLWLGDQRGHCSGPALWACTVYHPRAYSLVAVGTIFCHGYHRHAAWGKWHSQLWSQQLQQAQSSGVLRFPHCIRWLLLREALRCSRDPGDYHSFCHCTAGCWCTWLSPEWFIKYIKEIVWQLAITYTRNSNQLVATLWFYHFSVIGVCRLWVIYDVHWTVSLQSNKYYPAHSQQPGRF